jgi:hypothetical protein
MYMARPGKTTLAKREREKAKAMRAREQEERRAQRKAAKLQRPPVVDGEDPDLAGLFCGPQPRRD